MAITHWVEEGVGSKPFAGGDKPHYGDVCVYGCLKAIDRTSVHKEIMAEATELRQWYQRMAQLIGKTSGSYASP